MCAIEVCRPGTSGGVDVSSPCYCSCHSGASLVYCSMMSSSRSALRPLRSLRFARTMAGAAIIPAMPRSVRIYEVGARDGLQNEPTILPTKTRIELCNKLAQTGAAAIETTAFVNPKLVPQMSDASEIVRAVQSPPGTGLTLPVLIPNMRGYHNAVEAGVKSVAVMTAASETFSQNNIRMSVAQSCETAVAILKEAKANGVATRGYISCCLGCPFEGDVDYSVVASIAKRLYDAGCDEIVISDTIGTGTPGSMATVLDLTLRHVPVSAIAVHCHDTYGQALANIYCALLHGVSTIDSSVAGLGGCPFAGPGAAGNVATEDVVYMLDGLGIQSGVDFDQVVDIGQWVVGELGRENASKAAQASIRRRQATACHTRELTLSLHGDEDPSSQTNVGGRDADRRPRAAA
jgi:hydroxymethylglutaryl-CoA lyase